MNSVRPFSRPAGLEGRPPVEAAGLLRHLPGLVFFDSAREPGGLSVVAARPFAEVRGTIERDWPRLQAELRRHAVPAGADDGLPRGFAAGAVGYDGQFHFGFYHEALVYEHAT